MRTVAELPAAGPAVVAHAAGDLRIESIPLPAPLPDQAVVEIAYGGICGSDLHYWLHGAAGESVLKAPIVLGHEIVGTVIRAAADGSGPAEGAQVAVHPATPGPGEGPDYARYPEDRPNLSPGCTYLGSAARFPHTDGAFSRYVNLPSRMLRVLPPGLDLRTAALIEPASVAWHAVARAGDIRGKTALVVGCGPIGALAVAVLKRAGAARLVATDLHRKPLETAQALGADDVLEATDSQALAEVHADDLLILGVDWGEEASAVTDFADRYGVTYPILLDPGLDNYYRWAGTDGLPRHYFIGADGTVMREVIGPLDPARMVAMLAELGVSR